MSIVHGVTADNLTLPIRVNSDGSLASVMQPGVTTITGGTDTRVLFNDGGKVGEDAGLTYNKTTDQLVVGADIVTPKVSTASGALLLNPNSSVVQFGGTTSSFPAIKRSATALQVRLADDSAAAPLAVSHMTVGALVTETGATHTVAVTENTIIANRAGTVTVTLPAAASFTGRQLRFVTIQAQAVVSDASNVVPRAGGAAGTAILGASDGAWADLESDGTNWIITASS